MLQFSHMIHFTEGKLTQGSMYVVSWILLWAPLFPPHSLHAAAALVYIVVNGFKLNRQELH